MTLIWEKMSFCPYFLKYLAICPCFETVQEYVPILKLNFFKIDFQCKTRFIKNQVIGNET